MKLDRFHALEIKIAARGEDGGFLQPLYGTPEEFEAACPGREGSFVFCVIDARTGKEPPNMAEAYESADDAYSAYQLRATRSD